MRAPALLALPLWLFTVGPAHAARVPPPRPSPRDAARDAISRALDFTVTLTGGNVYGAGVLIDPAAGLVVTALHVVDGVTHVSATFRDGTTVAARLLDEDRALDLALLAVPPQRRRGPELAPPDALRPGDEVYAIGCPRRLAFSVSRGIVSYVGRPLDGVRWLQTDLPINVGNSGGPVIDAEGRLVGLMSFVLRDAQGLSFALPARAIARRFAARLPRLRVRPRARW